MKLGTLKMIVPPLFFVLFLVDGQVSGLFENILKFHLFATGHILLIAFIVGVTRLSKVYVVVLAIVLGFLMDSYYTGILGIQMLMLPLCVFYIYRFKEVLNRNIFTQLFGTIIFVTLYEIGSAIIQGVFQLADVNVLTFITQILGPTLISNMLLFFMVIFPLKKLFRKG